MGRGRRDGVPCPCLPSTCSSSWHDAARDSDEVRTFLGMDGRWSGMTAASASSWSPLAILFSRIAALEVEKRSWLWRGLHEP